MSSSFDNAEDVLRNCAEQSDAALVVLTEVTGGTLRARGAMMSISPSSAVGYISNGCVDGDIIARARAGQSGKFTYGEGSPYRDIVLPCGGRLEIEIIQSPDQTVLRSAVARLENREIVEFNLGAASVVLKPRLKLRIAGRGAACLALAELASLSGFDVLTQSPDADLLPHTQHLSNPSGPPLTYDDERTAVVFLFHDHDWERALLPQALAGPAFYIGAMGSQRTHDQRCQMLLALGLPADDIERIRGPVGLVGSQRNARLLALSILAEIIQAGQQAKLL